MIRFYQIIARCDDKPAWAYHINKEESLMKKALALVVALALCISMLGAALAEVQVGIVLPTKDEPRWIQDQTRFESILNDAGFTAASRLRRQSCWVFC